MASGAAYGIGDGAAVLAGVMGKVAMSRPFSWILRGEIFSGGQGTVGFWLGTVRGKIPQPHSQAIKITPGAENSLPIS